MTDWLETAGARRLPLLGASVDAMTQEGFFASVALAIANGELCLVANHNVNSLAIYQKNAEFRRFFDRSDLIFIDGMPVVFMARALGYRVTYDERLAVLEWFWPLMQRAAVDGWRIVHLGSKSPVIEAALGEIRTRQPDVQVVAIPGYFDQSQGSADSKRVLEEVTAAAPDVLLVGMGMPLQELWILRHLEDLPPCVVVTVGGIMGFIGGERPTAPRWMGRYGVEWIFRLVSEPRRLWRRYFIEPWVLVLPFLRQLVLRFRGR